MRQPRSIDSATLRQAALHYVARYSTTSVRLRRVLQQRLRRAAQDDRDFAEDAAKQQELQQVIEALVVEFAGNRYFDDQAFAENLRASLRRRGCSSRSIAQKMQQEGLSIAPESMPTAEADLLAALRLAKRKKLGVYALDPAENDPKRRQRELAILARAGFSHSISHQALKGVQDEGGIE
jgi:regulatory protein